MLQIRPVEGLEPVLPAAEGTAAGAGRPAGWPAHSARNLPHPLLSPLLHSADGTASELSLAYPASAGAITTLGRGGSDLTATLIGAALGVAEVQVWKDVDGAPALSNPVLASPSGSDEILARNGHVRSSCRGGGSGRTSRLRSLLKPCAGSFLHLRRDDELYLAFQGLLQQLQRGRGAGLEGHRRCTPVQTLCWSPFPALRHGGHRSSSPVRRAR